MAWTSQLLATHAANASRSIFIARIALMVIAVGFWVPMPPILWFALGWGGAPTDAAGWIAVLLIHVLMFPIAMSWRYPVAGLLGYVTVTVLAFAFGFVSSLHAMTDVVIWRAAAVMLGVSALSLGLNAAFTVWRWSGHTLDPARDQSPVTP